MIVMVFGTDPSRIVGASSFLGNIARMMSMPIRELKPVMDEFLKGDAIIVGRKTSRFYGGQAPNYNAAYVLSHNPEFQHKKPGWKSITSPEKVIEQFKDSEDVLIVAGGVSVWKLFLPHVHEIRIGEVQKSLPGDLLFDEWVGDEFVLKKSDAGRKVIARTYVRSK